MLSQGIKLKFISIIAAVIIISSMHSAAWAAIMPRVRLLYSLTGEDSGQRFKKPGQLFIDEIHRELYIYDTDNKRIVIYDMKGTYLYNFAIDGGVSALVVDKKGEIYAAQNSKNRVAIFNYRGVFLREVDFSSVPGYETVSPTALFLDREDNLYIGDRKNLRVLVFDTNRRYRLEIKGGEGEGGFLSIGGLALNMDGRIYIVDTISSKISVFNKKGEFLFRFGNMGSTHGGFSQPVKLVIDQAGRILVLDLNRWVVIAFDDRGNFMSEFNGLDARVGNFRYPSDIETDKGGRLYIADTHNDRVLVLRIDWNPSGEN